MKVRVLFIEVLHYYHILVRAIMLPVLAEYSAESPTNKKVKTLEKFFQVHRLEYQREEIEEKRSFPVNLEELLHNQSIKEGFLSLREELIESPDTIMAILGLAMHQVNLHFVFTQLDLSL